MPCVRDHVKVAAETTETKGTGLAPEILLERLGFPRSQQQREASTQSRMIDMCSPGTSFI